MSRTCANCGENMGGVGGFMLARDVLKILKDEPVALQEFCTKCVENHRLRGDKTDGSND